MNIEKISYKKALELKCLEKESIDFKFYPNCQYLGAFENGSLIGMVAWQMVGQSLRFKSDCVLPAFRKRGVYSALWNAREVATKDVKCSSVSAYCTPMSIGMYLSRGFVKGKTNKYGITFVKKDKR